MLAVAALALQPSQADARIKRCDHKAAPVLCQIHYWVRVTHRAQRQLAANLSPYRWYAERASSSPDFRRWIRHEWRQRAGRWTRRLHPYSAEWFQAALCVHSHEGAWTSNTGNGYYGGLQYDVGTWLSNGGGRFASTADQATPAQQLLVAYWTWQARGWTPWPNTAAMCGLL